MSNDTERDRAAHGGLRVPCAECELYYHPRFMHEDGRCLGCACPEELARLREREAMRLWANRWAEAAIKRMTGNDPSPSVPAEAARYAKWCYQECRDYQQAGGQ